MCNRVSIIIKCVEIARQNVRYIHVSHYFLVCWWLTDKRIGDEGGNALRRARITANHLSCLVSETETHTRRVDGEEEKRCNLK